MTDRGTESETESGPAARAPESFWPRWLRLFLGRQIVRVCPVKDQTSDCAGCCLRVFCKCAQAEFIAAGALERKLWLVLAACGALAIVYAVLSFVHLG